MIVLILALYSEAKPLIDFYKLHSTVLDKESALPSNLSKFASDDNSMFLYVTRPGYINSVISIPAIINDLSCISHESLNDSFFINIGSAALVSNTIGEAKGKLFLINKITDTITDRDFYPDMLFNSEVEEALLKSFPNVLNKSDINNYRSGSCISYDTADYRISVKKNVLADMEGAFIYQALSRYIGPHQFSFLKFITDTGVDETLNEELISKTVEENLAPISHYIDIVKEAIRADYESPASRYHTDFDKLSTDGKMSKVMKDELLQLFRYAQASDIDIDKIIDSFYSEGLLPVKNKKDGKLLLEDLSRKVINETAKPSSNCNITRDSYHVRPFSHIYIEEELLNNRKAADIVSHFPDSELIIIRHYKDIFNRRRQSYRKQFRSKALILARQEGNLIYPGATVCQSFGNDNFYYASNVYGCPFNCEYCYLKGLYETGNICLFVNLKDYFDKIDEITANKNAYISISYDTDLLALEHITGFIKEWHDYLLSNPKLSIEIRSKSADLKLWQSLRASDRFIVSFTLSPDEISSSVEHLTASLDNRLMSIRACQDAGFKVRLSFDPIIYLSNYREVYDSFLKKVFSNIDKDKILDVSIGSFRISQSYMKKMRKVSPYSPITQFPYSNTDGYYQYPKELQKAMEKYVYDLVKSEISEDKIFLWKEEYQ